MEMTTTTTTNRLIIMKIFPFNVISGYLCIFLNVKFTNKILKLTQGAAIFLKKSWTAP